MWHLCATPPKPAVGDRQPGRPRHRAQGRIAEHRQDLPLELLGVVLVPLLGHPSCIRHTVVRVPLPPNSSDLASVGGARSLCPLPRQFPRPGLEELNRHTQLRLRQAVDANPALLVLEYHAVHSADSHRLRDNRRGRLRYHPQSGRPVRPSQRGRQVGRAPAHPSDRAGPSPSSLRNDCTTRPSIITCLAWVRKGCAFRKCGWEMPEPPSYAR